MIQKLKYNVIGKNGIGYEPSIEDIITKVNEVIDYINSQPGEKPSEELEEAAKEYMKKARKHLFDDSPIGRTDDAFIAGAEWMRKKDVEDMYMSDNRHFLKCYDQGKVDMKVEMMKDAVEGEVIYDLGGFFRIKSEAIDGAKYKVGSWVKLIIVKED